MISKWAVVLLVLTSPFVCPGQDLTSSAATPNTSDSFASAEQALSDDLPIVQAAALHQQTLHEAPANVSVISGAEIRDYGYRTLGEALNSLRGFYLSYDRIYHYIGLRGIELPGDFNTRLLVMINGHSMTEHVYDSNNFFGQDFGLDLDLVERIEIIRGPASALYGSNAMLATINVITRSPVDSAGLRVSTEQASFGEHKVFLSESAYLGKGANLLLSGSFFYNTGQDLFFPADPESGNSFGRIDHSDGEVGHHLFANLVWGDWTFTAYFNSRKKAAPMNWASDALFGEHGSHVRDGRDFVEAARTQEIGAKGKLRYRFYYDDYRYDDRFDYNEGYIEDQRSASRNEWVGSEITWSHPWTARGDVVVGVQGEWELRNYEDEHAVSPRYERLVQFNVPDRNIALFTQQEWRLNKRWTAYGGLRLDHSQLYGQSLSPRLAMVYQQSAATVYKAVFGRPFRNPSAFERFFSDGEILVPNQNLHAEHALTFELSAEHTFHSGLTGILNYYDYRTADLIQEVFPPADSSGGTQDIPYFSNLERARSTGLEAEISAKLPGHFEISCSASLQRAIAVDEHQALANSPQNLEKIRIGIPVFRQRLFMSTAASYMSSRFASDTDLTPAVFLQDFTLITRKPLAGNVMLQGGIRNLWNRRYQDPVGLAVDRIQEDGRAFFLKITWKSLDR